MAALSSQQPKSSLASDPQLAPFLAPNFSAVDYLNSTLPSWTPSPQSTIPTASTSTTSSSSLADIAAQTQTTLTQLNAQLTRLSSTLTALTDDILRAGGRLAYEVELLRGDAGSLGDALVEGLKKDIEHFVPPAEAQSILQPLQQDSQQANVEPVQEDARAKENAETQKAVTRLHTLTLVRDRLDAVVRVFGDAMAWPVAPSDVSSLKSSFITVTGPSADSTSETEKLERAGKEHTQKLRAEIAELLSAGTDEGELAALRRLESLRSLAGVWAGTSEEKARIKIVDGLARMVEERKKGGPSSNAAARSGYGLGADLTLRPGQDGRR